MIDNPAPDETPEPFWPAWLFEGARQLPPTDVGGAVPAARPVDPGAEPGAGRGASAQSPSAQTGLPGGELVLVGQAGAVAGLMIALAVDAWARRPRMWR